MKLFAFFVCVAALVALAAAGKRESKQEFKAAFEACKPKQSDNEEDVALEQKGVHGHHEHHGHHGRHGHHGKSYKTENRDLDGNVSRCIITKMGLMSEDGQLDIEAIKTNYTNVVQTKEKFDNLISNCTKQLDTPEETAAAFVKCLRNLKGHHSTGHDAAGRHSAKYELKAAFEACESKELVDEDVTLQRVISYKRYVNFVKKNRRDLDGNVSRCIITKMGLMPENGQLDYEAIKARYTDAIQMDNWVNNCFKQLDTPEETATVAVNCLKNLHDKDNHHHHHHGRVH